MNVTAAQIGKELAAFLVVVMLISLTMIVTMSLQMRWEEQNERIVAMAKPGQPTKPQLRKAMRFHGIQFAQCNAAGEWFFVRDGQRCRLLREGDR